MRGLGALRREGRMGELPVVAFDEDRLLVASASAAWPSAANSRSTISTFASPWSIWKAIVAASSRVLIVFSTAPSIGTP